MNDEDDILAAELALGLLDGGEREAALRRVGDDAALAQRVEWWRDQFEPLSVQDNAEPSNALWPRIEAMLPRNDNVALMQARRWRAAALAAMLVAALLGVTMALRPAPVTQPSEPATASAPVPVLLASVAGDSGVVATIAYDGAAGRLTIVPGTFNTSQSDAELWIIPAGGSPHSLGIIDPAHPTTAAARADARAFIAPGSTFAISLEPRGGSPTGQPTGPILGSGKINGV